jgi:hypothetical protein
MMSRLTRVLAPLPLRAFPAGFLKLLPTAVQVVVDFRAEKTHLALTFEFVA